jgi:predicted small metal-binding protein
LTLNPDCGLAVKSRAKEEVIASAKEHGKKYHQLDMPDSEIEKMEETISA